MGAAYSTREEKRNSCKIMVRKPVENTT